MIKTLLWDIDGTLLDFSKAEEYGIRKCFEVFSLGECTDEMLSRYSVINRKYWEMLERNELTKPEVLRGRFEEFFRTEGIEFDKIDEFNLEYQYRLGDIEGVIVPVGAFLDAPVGAPGNGHGNGDHRFRVGEIGDGAHQRGSIFETLNIADGDAVDTQFLGFGFQNFGCQLHISDPAFRSWRMRRPGHLPARRSGRWWWWRSRSARFRRCGRG